MVVTVIQSLVAVAPRLGPKDAASSADLLAQTLANANDPLAKTMLAQLRTAAQSVSWDAERTADVLVTEAIGGSQDALILMALPERLSGVADHLSPGAALRCADRLTEAMAKSDKAVSLQSLATSLAVITHRLAPDDAARRCGMAASRLSAAMAKTTNADDCVTLAHGLSALAGRLERKDAVRVCTQAVTRLAESMAATSHAPTLSGLAESVAELAPWLEPADALRHRRAAAQALIRAMNNHANPAFLSPGLFKVGLEVDDVPCLANLLIQDNRAALLAHPARHGRQFKVRCLWVRGDFLAAVHYRNFCDSTLTR